MGTPSRLNPLNQSTFSPTQCDAPFSMVSNVLHRPKNYHGEHHLFYLPWIIPDRIQMDVDYNPIMDVRYFKKYCISSPSQP